jgi:hypothetical protein
MYMESSAASTATVGWFEKVKTALGLDKLHITTDMIIQGCLYLGAGFLVGFLLKRLSTYLLAIVLSLVFILLLTQVGWISMVINTNKIQEFFGLQASDQTTVLVALWGWAKAHVAYVLSFGIGFFIGLKVS